MFRVTVMFCALGAGLWALVEFGPKETVQPLARRAIEFADKWIGQANADVAQESVPVPGPKDLPTTRLVAVPGPNDLTTISAPPLAPVVDPTPLQRNGNSLEAPTTNEVTSPANESAVLAPLVALGVRNLQLARWGREGRFHRVSGDMSVGHRAGMLRHVEAVAQDSAVAVADVERQVLAWQLRDQRPARDP
jgi:hypothetical protein